MSDWIVRQTRRRGRGDRGQTSFEYLGIVVVIAIIIGVLATTSIGDTILNGILQKITDIIGAG
jgi:hypothetical protein